MNLMELLKNPERIREQLKQTEERLRKTVVSGSSGGDMVTVEMDCAMTIRSVRISQEAIDTGDAQMLGDLVQAAFSAAMDNARTAAKDELQPGQLPGFGFPTS